MQLLKLRYFQLRRDLGIWVLILATVVFFISHWIAAYSSTYALGFAALVVLSFYSYHLNRKDLGFVKNYLEKPLQQIAVNYNLLCLPISAGLLCSGEWLSSLLLHAGVTLTVFFSVRTTGAKLLFIASWIPAAQFEWISGLRKNFYVLVFLFIAALFFSPVKFFATVALLLLNSLFLGFYSAFEPLLLLNPRGLSIKDFLSTKIVFFQKVLLIVNVPVLLINSFFYPDIAWFNLCFLLGFFILASSAVYLKYAMYTPNEELRFHLDFLWLYASVLVPFLLPIAYYMNLSHKKKAIQHLSAYLDDHS